ncbi:MAG TPA: EAL domain-containing protein [Burkholderiaceae bacterium]|nr:EAL domain-containing protein [Burkholderiaceae bacterium]
MRWPDWSLRSRLIVACVLVQSLACVLVVFASTRLLQRTLLEQARSESATIAVLLDQAIAAPLAQRDYATLQQTLDLVRSDHSIRYLALSDHRGKRVVSSGLGPDQPLPPRDAGEIDIERADGTLHLRVPVSVGGQPLGQVDFGLSTAALREARADFLRHSYAIGAGALIASMLALAAIAYAITRHLARLAQASAKVAEGDFSVQVPVTTDDEIGRLAGSFNAMAAAVKQRVAALEVSEAQQRVLLTAARDEQSRLTTLLGAMHGGIMFVDAERRVLYANASFARIWLIPPPVAGQRLADIVPLLSAQTGPADAAHLGAMLRVATGEPMANRELHTLDGRVIAQRMQPVPQGSEISGCIWFHDDVTLERQTQQRAYQALHDPLTALLNRRGLYESLHPAFANAAAVHQEVALLFIDLDDFKHANDVGGHRTGDEILMAVARVLSGHMHRGEIVARLGGDEFAVLCPGVNAAAASELAAGFVQAVSSLRFEAAAQILRVGCSVGIAIYPTDATTEDELIACADSAMYEAKRSGKNGWALYRNDPLRSQAEAVRVDWNARIHRALQDHLFVLHFQPVHRASDLRVSHHEALIRMVDERDITRLIAPGDFVPHAERSGKIRQIDRWVFEACVQLLARAEPGVSIAANLSARSLEDASFPGYLRDLLERYDVDPRRLHIELTETSAIGDALAARVWINGLRGLGCAVHLDDFGSGFSSFAHLKLLDVDAIKIDGAFIRDLRTDPSNRLFVASMIEIAHSLNKRVVAEQVEDGQTLEVLRSLGVDFVQGFHLGRPSVRLADSRPPKLLQIVPDRRRGAEGQSA